MGPNEKRLRAALSRADFHQAISRSRAWTYQGLNVGWVVDGLREVAPRLSEYGISGRTPDAAQQAFLRLADKMERQRADLDKAGKALSDAANEFWEAHRVLDGNPQRTTDPGSFHHDLDDSRSEEQQRLDHNGKTDAYAAESAAREATFGEALRKVDKQYYESAVTLSEVHGMGAPPDPYAPGPGGSGSGGGGGGSGGGGSVPGAGRGAVPGGGGGVPVPDPLDPDPQDPEPVDPDPEDPDPKGAGPQDPGAADPGLTGPAHPDETAPMPTVPTHPSPHPGGPLGPTMPSLPEPSADGSPPGHALTRGVPAPAAGAIGAGLAGGAVAGRLTGAIRGAAGPMGRVGVAREAAPDTLGASGRTNTAGALGRAAGAPGPGVVGSVGGAAGRAPSRSAAVRSAGRGVAAGGRRVRDDEEERREHLDPIAETSEWIDDDGAAPGVIDRVPGQPSRQTTAGGPGSRATT